MTGRIIWTTALAGMVGCGTQSPPPAARLAIEPPEAIISIDGDDRGSEQELHFKLTNVGGKPLTIRKVLTPCCQGGVSVATPIAKETLAPGDSTNLVLKAAPPRIGRFEKSVMVQTDLPESSAIVLKFVGGELHPPYVIGDNPLDVELSGPIPGIAVERKMKICAIESADAKPWILGLNSAEDSIAAELIGEPEDRPVDQGVVTRYYEFLIRGIVPKTSDIAMAAAMEIQTASESVQPLRGFLVRVRLVPAIRVVPTTLIIPNSEQFPVERRVLLIPKDGEEVHPKVVSILPEWISVIEDQAAAHLPPGAKRFLIQINQPADATLSDITVEFRCENENVNVPVRFANL